MSAKAAFLRTLQDEHARTRKLLDAFPAEKSEFKPHDRSNTAMMLAWTFVIEEQLMLKAIQKNLELGGGCPKPPETWNAILQMFEEGFDQVVQALGGSAELDGTVTFFVGPKQTGDIPIMDFLWFMLHDQIHHRGQLSVYTRMAGGKVPSIYGPSADEPWR
jgi:uncharacterized damage-inducible protein DinB